MKIAMDTTYAGRVYLCEYRDDRFVWSRHRQPLEISKPDAVVAAEIGKVCVIELVVTGFGGDVVGVVTFKNDGKEGVRGQYIAFVKAVNALLDHGDFFHKEFGAIGCGKDFTCSGKPCDGVLGAQVADGAGRCGVKLPKSGYGVGSASQLENAVPLRIDGSAGEQVGGTIVGRGHVDAIHKPETCKVLSGANSAARAIAADDTVKLALVIENGKVSGVAREGVVALVLHAGQYFIVDGERCDSVKSLSEHVGGHSGEDLHSANRRMLGYFVKYVAKSI